MAMRYFNTEGVCRPNEHYMVRIDDRLKKIKRLYVDRGKRIPFSPAEKSIHLGVMFGFLKEQDGYVTVANRIFEMYLLNLFIAEEAVV